VGLIVPATSKGISAQHLDHLSLGASLLPSLYLTRSPGFNYHIYLTVNEHDPIYSNSVLTHTIFDVAYSVAKEKFFSSLNSSEHSSAAHQSPEDMFPRIPHRVILVPDSMLPKRALSALFNIPTLVAAHSDNCDYFYVVNDDLLLKSYHWTEKLVEPLVNNPVYPGLGVSGGIDVSDSITPQIEFPFFSRTHVELFPWCGCNPWIFKNWWEDNWLTDIYLPFDSIFYRRDVVVENYIGLDVKVAVSGKTGSADPSYSVTEGRRTPFFYTEEVERARDRIMTLLESCARGGDRSDHLDDSESAARASPALSGEDLPEMLAFVEGFDNLLLEEETVAGRTPGSTTVPGQGSTRPEMLAALATSTEYCTGIHERTPSLLTMPVAPHEYVLDPCDAHLHAHEHRLFVPEVHSVELPHTAYAGLLSEKEAAHSQNNKELSQFEKDKKEAVDVCKHYYTSLDHFQKNQRFHRLDDLDDDLFQDWEACVHKVGFDKFFALKALQKSELCRSNPPQSQQGGTGTDTGAGTGTAPAVEYDSCRASHHLKVLILHNHAPLFTRYGSDKRLYHIAETLVGLGHEVVFGGSFVSGLETPDDHLRLRHIDAKLYSPLAIDSGDQNGIYADQHAFSAMLEKEQPDVVFMTLWFWNTPPTTVLYMDLLRRLAPHVRIGVVSDDAHTLREELLLSTDQVSLTNSVIGLLGVGKDTGDRSAHRADKEAAVKRAQAYRIYKQIRTLEYLAYAKADVVLTITDNDRDKILRTKAGITPMAVPRIDRGRYARGPEPDRDRDVSPPPCLVIGFIVDNLQCVALSLFSLVLIHLALLYCLPALIDGSIHPLDSQYLLLMSPLAADKIRLVRYALSPTEIVSNFGLKLRRGASGGTLEGQKRAHLSFVGNGANPTNIAAMRWFASEIFDLIRKEIPGVQLILIGACGYLFTHQYQ
jgi:hypothetical protein